MLKPTLVGNLCADCQTVTSAIQELVEKFTGTGTEGHSVIQALLHELTRKGLEKFKPQELMNLLNAEINGHLHSIPVPKGMAA